MVTISEIPQALLDKLAQCFPQEDHDIFYKRYEQMYNMRLEAEELRRNQERQEG